MIVDGRIKGLPIVLFADTKANIEALSLVADDNGAFAFATDTYQRGVYDHANTKWRWGAGLEDVIVVAKGGGDYATLTTAEAACSGGELVIVCPGTYTEDVTIDQAITMIAFGEVTIAGSVTISVPEVVFDGFTVYHQENSAGIVSALETTASISGEIFVQNCDLHGENTNSGEGIGAYIHNTAGTVIIRRSRIYGEGNGGNGIAVKHTQSVTSYLRECVLLSTTADIEAQAGNLYVAHCVYDPSTVQETGGYLLYEDAEEILESLLSVDGDGSGLDADTVDGREVFANAVTRTVGSGKDHATIQDAVDWFKGKILIGTNTIAVDADAYDEAVVFEDLISSKSGQLVLQGDARALAGLTYVSGAATASAWTATTAYSLGNVVRPTTPNRFFYVCTTAGTSGGTEPTWPTTIGGTVGDGTVTWTCFGATANPAAKTNGGSGVCEIANSGTNITVTCSTTNPDFGTDGWTNGDRLLTLSNAGAVAIYTISSVSGNVITLTATAPALGNAGTAIALIPNRSIDRSTAGPCIDVDMFKGLTVTGFYLETSTGANCHGIRAASTAFCVCQNVLVNSEDGGFYATGAGSYIYAGNGACSVWVAAYGMWGQAGGVVRAPYSFMVKCTNGVYCNTFSYVEVTYSFASTCTTAFRVVEHSMVYAVYSTAFANTIGWYASLNSFMYAYDCDKNSYLNSTEYSPAPSLPGSAEGNNYGVLYAS